MASRKFADVFKTMHPGVVKVLPALQEEVEDVAGVLLPSATRKTSALMATDTTVVASLDGGVIFNNDYGWDDRYRTWPDGIFIIGFDLVHLFCVEMDVRLRRGWKVSPIDLDVLRVDAKNGACIMGDRSKQARTIDLGWGIGYWEGLLVSLGHASDALR